MKKEFLSFDTALGILMHSFLKRIGDYWRDYIDFQHPSIRDMLISYLQSEPHTKKLYLKKVSAVGLPALIKGLRHFNDASSETHKTMINNESELDILRERIQQILRSPVDYNITREILNSTNALIPRNNTLLYAAPNEVDIKAFTNTPEGILVRLVLEEIGANNFYKKKSFKFEEWINIIEKFYTLNSYVYPILRIEYLEHIINMYMEQYSYMDMEFIMRFLKILQNYERNWFEQIFTKKMNDKIDDILSNKISELEEESNHFTSLYYEEDEYSYSGYSFEEYNEWEEEIKEAKMNLENFTEIAITETTYSVEEIVNIIEKTEPPNDPEEYDEPDDADSSFREETLEIESIFKDL